MPKVSVLIPHFRCEAFLAEAVGSILGQKMGDLEVHVADDATPDDRWLEVLRPFRHDPRLIVWKASANVGPYRIKNVLLERSDSPFVALQDADDRSHPERIGLQVEYLEKHQADVVGCWCRYMNEAGKIHEWGPVFSNVNLWRWLGKRTVLRQPTAVMRRSIFDVLRGFDGTARVSADEELMYRAVHAFKVRNIRRFLYDIRTLSNSLSRDPSTGLKAAFRLEYEAKYHREEAERWRTRNPKRMLELLTPPPNDVAFTLDRV